MFPHLESVLLKPVPVCNPGGSFNFILNLTSGKVFLFEIVV